MSDSKFSKPISTRYRLTTTTSMRKDAHLLSPWVSINFQISQKRSSWLIGLMASTYPTDLSIAFREQAHAERSKRKRLKKLNKLTWRKKSKTGEDQEYQSTKTGSMRAMFRSLMISKAVDRAGHSQLLPHWNLSPRYRDLTRISRSILSSN